jgi:hypothetical protein
MAATVNDLTFTGRDGIPFTVSTYNAANGAVGTYLRCDMNQISVSTSPDNLIVPKDCYLTEWVAGAASGTVELISNGKSTGIFVNFASHQATNSGRPKLAIPVTKGTELRFKVISVLPA